MIRPPPTSTLFPYTTLFRALREPDDRYRRLVPSRTERLILHWDDRAISRARLVVPLYVSLAQIVACQPAEVAIADRKSTRLNSSHANISYAVFCLNTKTTIS